MVERKELKKKGAYTNHGYHKVRKEEPHVVLKSTHTKCPNDDHKYDLDRYIHCKKGVFNRLVIFFGFGMKTGADSRCINGA